MKRSNKRRYGKPAGKERPPMGYNLLCNWLYSEGILQGGFAQPDDEELDERIFDSIHALLTSETIRSRERLLLKQFAEAVVQRVHNMHAKKGGAS